MTIRSTSRLHHWDIQYYITVLDSEFIFLTSIVRGFCIVSARLYFPLTVSSGWPEIMHSHQIKNKDR